MAALFLSGCITLNDPFEIFRNHSPAIQASQVIDEYRSIDQFSIKAKFAYSLDSKGGSGRLIWRYENNQDEIDKATSIYFLASSKLIFLSAKEYPSAL